MLEYYSEAIVLNKEALNDTDGLIYFYTEQFGKVIAKAKGLRRILSKSNPHLEPLSFVKIRLINNKNGYFQLIDALSDKENLKKIKGNQESLIKHLRIINFIDDMTFEFQPDLLLWQVIKEIIKRDLDEFQAYQLILKVSGFNPEFSQCAVCSNKNTFYFNKVDNEFLCLKCSLPAFKTAKNADLIKIRSSQSNFERSQKI